MIPRSIKIENEILVSRTIKIDREVGEHRLRNVEIKFTLESVESGWIEVFMST